MQPNDLTTPVFHGGIHAAGKRLGRLDRGAADPAPLTHNPATRRQPDGSDGLSKREIIDFYRTVAQEIYSLIPGGLPPETLYR